jgi:hypothetical protein
LVIISKNLSFDNSTEAEDILIIITYNYFSEN